LLDRELDSPAVDEDACRRYFEGHASQFVHGERVRARHVLFAVTPGVDVNALRTRAEACLLDLRCESSADSTRFADVAASTSNCPSGAAGGDLGWLQECDCAPEFAREIFGRQDTGVLSRLVHSRFGLHVVEVLAREPGTLPPFEAVYEAVAQSLERQRFTTSLRQYLQLLAGQAVVKGIDLDASESPLVQ
jgi:peptidyl-prolyl cis-trans isomerase C